MKTWIVVAAMAAGLTGCAAGATVQRMAVDYNATVEGMANELTLLNIVRAKHGLPLHYTTLGRLSGGVTMKASGGVNNQFRDAQPTDLNSTTTTTTTTPANTTVAQVLSRSVLSGGDVLTPNLGAEISSSPSFEVTILDTQKFYQGVLGAIPFSTVEMYLNQGYDPDLILRLFVESVVYRAKEAENGYEKGEVIKIVRNAASGADSTAFLNEFACYRLAVATSPAAAPLAPFSRVAAADPAAPGRISLEDLARLDGKALGLSKALGADPNDDGQVMVVRPGSDRRGPQFAPRDCLPLRPLSGAETPTRRRPITPPSEALFVGESRIEVAGPNGNVQMDATMELVFRSPEAVIRYVGAYLRGAETDADQTYKLGVEPLFTLKTGWPDRPAVASSLYGESYWIARDGSLAQNGAVLSIIQQLVNLQKESSDRPTAIPLQILP